MRGTGDVADQMTETCLGGATVFVEGTLRVSRKTEGRPPVTREWVWIHVTNVIAKDDDHGPPPRPEQD